MRSHHERSPRTSSFVRALRRTALHLCALLALPAAAATLPVAENFAVSAFDMYSGLPSHAVQNVYQTRDGYLWLGSESGLARFDGSRFVTFRVVNTPELPANLIRCLWEDQEGWLWIGTQGGLCRQRGGKFERISGLDMRITALGSDGSGRVWIGTHDNGLYDYFEGRLTSHAGAPGMPADTDIQALAADATGRLWLVFRTAPLTTYHQGRATPVDTAPFGFRDFVDVEAGADGTIWIATQRNGVLRIRGDEKHLYAARPNFGREALRNLYVDRRGQLWALSNRAHLLNSELDRFEPLVIRGIENCRGMAQDHEGSYWIGSAGDGVVRLRPSGFKMLAPSDAPLGGNTRSIVIDAGGNLWTGDPHAGAIQIKPDGSQTTFPVPLEGTAAEVWSICPAQDGSIWFGCRGGLFRMRDGAYERISNLERVRAVHQDRLGRIWIGSETGGVDCYQDGQLVSWRSKIEARQAKPYGPMAMAFAEAADGTLYIGLREGGGLVAVKGDEITCWQDLPSNDIRCIYPDPQGNLWIGTKGRGLVLGQNGVWLNPPAFADAFQDPVAAVVEDPYGRLWLGTAKGIVSANKAQLLASAKNGTEVFSRLALDGDGVRPATIGGGYHPAHTQAADGRMWFASRQGVVAVDPHKIAINRVPPPVHIESVQVDRRHLPHHGVTRVVVPAGTHSLAFEYSGISFVGPSLLRFRYQLEGWDDDWVEAGSRREAIYGDLRPGTYRFRVLACNDDGVWNNTGASIEVVQLPFFYQTGWFYAGIAVTLLGTGLGLVRWRTASLQTRNQELQERIAERTAELARSYDAIRASEYFYHSLVESLPQVIARKDVDGRYTYVNTHFLEIAGFEQQAVIGKTDAEIFPPARAEKHRADDLRVMTANQPLEYETVYERDGRKRYYHVKNVPLCDSEGRSLGVQVLSWDMTSFREIEDKLKLAQRELVETSRLAGIAEMATGVLHNLGNALNSVTTTASLLTSRVRRSKVGSVRRVADLMNQQNGRLPEFFGSDRRGQQMPAFLTTLGDYLTAEQKEIMSELEALQHNIEHIKEVVAAQQQYAKVGGLTETLPASELVEFALRLNESALTRNGITIVRELMPAPRVKVERQKALQIIGNLLNNARDALLESKRPEKQVIVGVRPAPAGGTQIYVTDTGTGIAPENLTRIFAFGFTTKKTGHGFGLHSSALTATELGGSLTATSDGLGKGATFTLELPPAAESAT